MEVTPNPLQGSTEGEKCIERVIYNKKGAGGEETGRARADPPPYFGIEEKGAGPPHPNLQLSQGSTTFPCSKNPASAVSQGLCGNREQTEPLP